MKIVKNEIQHEYGINVYKKTLYESTFFRYVGSTIYLKTGLFW